MKKILQNKYVKYFLVAAVLVSLIYIVYPGSRQDNNVNKQINEITSKKITITAQKLENKKKNISPKETLQSLQKTIEIQNKNKIEKKTITKIKTDKYPAGKTIDIAWKTLVKIWNNQPNLYNFGIYTEMTKLIMKDSVNKNQNYFELNPEIYVDSSYEIIRKGNYAVIDFKNPTNNEHLPFLFCKTRDGWKFDLVNQRKLIRFDSNSYCGVERYISPYAAIVRKFPAYFGIDIPFEEKDIYKISDDTEIAGKIKNLEKLYTDNKMTYKKALKLARLYSITSLGSKAIPLLKKIKKELPKNPDVYKYMAIAYIDVSYDYSSAKKEMKEYVKLLPDNEFGHNFLGYLYMITGEYGKAESEFEKTLEINPKSCYSSAKLVRIYDESYKNLSDKNEKKTSLQQKYEKMFKNAQNFCKNKKYERFIWLIQWKHNQKK